ncbi:MULTISPECIES: thioredoxin family protein [unclassified Microbacterium]|uniref:TlpA family protein disulfide reductase n=1 Tax=unclassified Microbacterium TaxID=2609290 RepID=UPI001604E4D3|nr:MULTISPECIES: thioredoxin family protein [unclassified Microbacterium]QNA92448.1 thioredoxin family protein [Microbacterium sp. Se63.02b]QYM65742.1 thioredoxin family protein [Microbacterium sp. Se5.02b]
MSPTLALGLAAALLVLATTIGIVLRRRDGRRRDGGALHFDPADAATAEFGDRATLVQFSTEMCARCPQVRRLLDGYASDHEGLRHVEIDLTHRPDLSARYKVLQTPTTFVIDSSGAVRARFHGVPHRHALADALATV